jgi:toxin ParE1/3/4
VSANIIRRDQVIADLETLTDRIAKDSPKSAERFLKAVEKAIALLAEFPELGSRCEFRSPHIKDLRVWSIRRFKKYLIFYRPIENGIEIFRVLHGARDLEALFIS